jgi:hypothetical protein
MDRLHLTTASAAHILPVSGSWSSPSRLAINLKGESPRQSIILDSALIRRRNNTSDSEESQQASFCFFSEGID